MGCVLVGSMPITKENMPSENLERIMTGIECSSSGTVSQKQDKEEKEDEDSEKRDFHAVTTGPHRSRQRILAQAINTPLFSPDASDVHAEVNAIATCARRGQATEGATAYITMPPCKNCFMVLQVD